MSTESPTTNTPAAPALDRVQVLAVKANLLDVSGEQFSSSALAGPLPYLHNFAKEIKADDYNKEETDVKDITAQNDEVKTAVELERHLHHICMQAQALGLDVSITPTFIKGKAPSIALVQIPTTAAPAA